MERRLLSYTGCLLGLAAGDGLGHGPELLNGFLPVSAYTQIAAYAANGLLSGLTEGQLSGTMAPPVRYVGNALTEWACLQRWRPDGSPRCWISRSPRMDFRRCPEPEILDVLSAGGLGTMEDHGSSLAGPGALMTAPAVAGFFDPERLKRKELQRLGAEAAALTHGDPAAFLSAAALAHILSRILFDGVTDPDRLCREAGVMLLRRFGREYHQAWTVRRGLKKARKLAWSGLSRREALAQFDGNRASQALAGAVYCAMTCAGDVEHTILDAARWNPAGAAAAGAILGAVYGEEAIPGTWLEQIECASVLRELAEDLHRGCPMMRTGRVFDIEWDEKYHSSEL